MVKFVGAAIVLAVLVSATIFFFGGGGQISTPASSSPVAASGDGGGSASAQGASTGGSRNGGSVFDRLFGGQAKDGPRRTELAAGDIVTAITRDPDSAMQRYGDAPLRVTGTPMSLSVDSRGMGRITVGGNDEMFGASAQLGPDDVAYVKSRAEPGPVTLLCSGLGVNLGIAQLRNCTIER